MHEQYVRSLFDSIAKRYDFLNHLLSGGIDRSWRHEAIERLRNLAHRRILDVATGTGDLAIAAMALGPEEVVGIDIAEGMLALGRSKVARLGMEASIRLRTGNAEHVDFADGYFDAAMVAFGARNFEHLGDGLQEMRRVVRPGGRILVLEFSRPDRFFFRHLYFFYFRTLLPLIGRIVSGHRDAYAYLPETVMKFPQGEEFISILRSLGFTQVSAERLTFGIASIYLGTK